MATFLEDSKILLKSGSRFLVFHAQGDFVSGVQFDDSLLKEIDRLPASAVSFLQKSPSIIDGERKQIDYD